MNQSMNPMRTPRITKVSVNIGVGEGGQRLQLAEKALEMVTGMTPLGHLLLAPTETSVLGKELQSDEGHYQGQRNDQCIPEGCFLGSPTHTPFIQLRRIR